MTDRKVGKYSLVSHGLDSSSYFQGAGTSFTEWDDCYTGVGESEREALEDALENLATSDWDASSVEYDASEWSDKLDVHNDCIVYFRLEYPAFANADDEEILDSREWEQYHDTCEMHYFVTVYVQEAASEDLSEYCRDDCGSGCIFSGKYTKDSGLNREDFEQCSYMAGPCGPSCPNMLLPGDKCPAGHNS